MYTLYYYLFAFSNQYIGVVKLFMSISINPEKFAELVVGANPSKKENPEDIAKDSIDIYIHAYRLAEKYTNISSNCYDTAGALKELHETELNLSH